MHLGIAFIRHVLSDLVSCKNMCYPGYGKHTPKEGILKKPDALTEKRLYVS